MPPHIDKCVRLPKHVSGLLISLWEPANSLFVRNKYVTPTGKRLLIDSSGFYIGRHIYFILFYLAFKYIKVKYV